jgi:hypothetical protein
MPSGPRQSSTTGATSRLLAAGGSHTVDRKVTGSSSPRAGNAATDVLLAARGA